MSYIVEDTTLSVARAALAAEVTPSTAPVLSDADLDAALGRSKVVDAHGRPPSAPSYTPTYSILWAAAETARTRAIRALADSSVTSFSSEGSRFDVKQVDWLAIVRAYQARALGEAGGSLDTSMIKVIATVERTRATGLEPIYNHTVAPYPIDDQDGPDTAPSSTAFVHQQPVPLATWIIPHSFGRIPAVSVYLNTGEEIEPDVIASVTTVSIMFPTPTAGTAVLT